jgi:hypothetical protein
MRVLTLAEPWAWAIVDLAAAGNPAAKNVENRGRSFARYAGPLAIHSGSSARDQALRGRCDRTVEVWIVFAGRHTGCLLI